MKTYLMTRGTPRSSDYEFLGEAPPTAWWTPVAEVVVLEEPEVIVARHDGGLSVLVSGIPSVRRDGIGTPIRYTLVVDAEVHDLALLRRLVAAGLDTGGRQDLGKLLDEEFDAGYLDRVLADVEDGADVSGRTATVLASLTDAGLPDDGSDHPGSWVASAEGPGVRAAFLARVSWLTRQDSGFALTSHALSSVDGAAETIRHLPGEVVVLLVGSDVEGVHRVGKSPALPERRPGAVNRPALIALGLLGVVIVWWIVRRIV